MEGPRVRARLPARPWLPPAPRALAPPPRTAPLSPPYRAPRPSPGRAAGEAESPDDRAGAAPRSAVARPLAPRGGPTGQARALSPAERATSRPPWGPGG